MPTLRGPDLNDGRGAYWLAIPTIMNCDEFIAQALCNPVHGRIAQELAAITLPDAWIVAGCLTQTVWNVQTGRPAGYGISDYDVFYFDPDLSWEAEDAVIRAVRERLSDLDAQVEIRNQARVHLWYPDKHGRPYPPLTCATDGIDRFLTVNTQVGIRPLGDGYDVYAPKGFAGIAAMIVRPNRTENFSAVSYAAKAARWKIVWPEITVMPANEKSLSPPR